MKKFCNICTNSQPIGDSHYKLCMLTGEKVRYYHTCGSFERWVSTPQIGLEYMEYPETREEAISVYGKFGILIQGVSDDVLISNAINLAIRNNEVHKYISKLKAPPAAEGGNSNS